MNKVFQVAVAAMVSASMCSCEKLALLLKEEEEPPITEEPAEFTFTGNIGHGNELTISALNGGFGDRANVKPLYVNFGDARAGHALGRVTNDLFQTSAAFTVASTDQQHGSLSSAHRLDVKQNLNGNSMWTGGLNFDTDKPLIQYLERYYDFDVTQDKYFNGKYTIATAANSTYTVTIDGTPYSVSYVARPTNATVVADISALINADAACKQVASGTSSLELQPKVSGSYSEIITTSNFGKTFNLKPNRIWAGVGSSATNNNIYYSYHNPTAGGIYVEYTTMTIMSYFLRPNPPFTWMCQELIFKNSSAPGVRDGIWDFWQDNVLRNTGATNSAGDPNNRFVTFTDTKPTPMKQAFLDQVSNGVGMNVPHVYIYQGYACIDDEYKGVYFSNSATRAADSKMVRLPQTAWSDNQIKVHQVESSVAASGAHVHVRTDADTWIYIGQLN